MSGCLNVAALALVVALYATSAHANERSRQLTRLGLDAAYNLEYPDAVIELEKAIAADPNDADTHRAMALIAWLRIGFLRGSVTVDGYLGNVTRPNINMLPPPPDEAQRFHRHIARALELAESALRARPLDVDAHFSVGSIVAVQASYGATVEGRVLASFRAAKRAFDEHERVLSLAPSRKDAGFVVGTYRYIISALSLPVRLMAYVAGFGGGRERGLQMVEEASRMPSPTQTEAQFALVLLYNREHRFDDALRTLHDLQRRFPRNRLLWFEEGATLLRAGRFEQAAAAMDESIPRRLEADPRERMFGEIALWHYKRGTARGRVGRADAARADFERALGAEAREWVQGRSHAELGRLANLAGNREQARREYRLAIMLAERGNDPVGKAEAEALLKGTR